MNFKSFCVFSKAQLLLSSDPKIEFDRVWVEMHEFIPLFVFKQEVKEILTEDRIQDEWYVVLKKQ